MENKGGKSLVRDSPVHCDWKEHFHDRNQFFHSCNHRLAFRFAKTATCLSTGAAQQSLMFTGVPKAIAILLHLLQGMAIRFIVIIMTVAKLIIMWYPSECLRSYAYLICSSSAGAFAAVPHSCMWFLDENTPSKHKDYRRTYKNSCKNI